MTPVDDPGDGAVPASATPVREAAWTSGQITLTRRGTNRLLISFGNLEDVGHAEHDWPAQTDTIAEANGWSHLSVIGPEAERFRAPSLVADLERLRDGGSFAGFDDIALIGACRGGGGLAALSFAPLFPGATVIAFSPLSTADPARAPWDPRLISDTPAAPDAYADAAETIASAGRTYVFHDPFDALDHRHVARLPADDLIALDQVGMGQDTAIALRRLGVFVSHIELAIAGELMPGPHYQAMRARRQLYIYRRNIEETLRARAQDDRADRFGAAFKRLNRQRKIEAAARAARTAPAPAEPPPLPPPVRPPTTPAAPRPRGDVNAWMLRQDGDGLRYLSDRYRGRVMGFHERGDICLADTAPLALAAVSFGQANAQTRPLPEAFDWHIVDETLRPADPASSATAHAIARLSAASDAHRGLPTTLALSAEQAALTSAEAAPDAPLYQDLMARLGAGVARLADWGKTVFVSQVRLNLSSGAEGLTAADTTARYVALAQALTRDIARATGQASLPRFVLSQSAGSTTDGTSEAILAEGRLDIDTPTLGFIVATPSYPFALHPDMPATHSAAAQLLIEEIEALAVAEHEAGRPWYCPAMQEAVLKGRKITVTFGALTPLTLAEGAHGFGLSGAENAPRITHVVQEDDRRFVLTLSAVPKGPATAVTYAWGAQTDTPRPGQSANQGAVREVWSLPSRLQPGATLHRYALSGKVALTRFGGGTPTP